MATKQKKKQKPYKNIYYEGKTYTEEGFKRQLIKEGVLKVKVQRVYYVNVDKFNFDYGSYLDFDYLLEELEDNDWIENANIHYEDCPTYNDFGSQEDCAYCPWKNECKAKQL